MATAKARENAAAQAEMRERYEGMIQELNASLNAAKEENAALTEELNTLKTDSSAALDTLKSNAANELKAAKEDAEKAIKTAEEKIAQLSADLEAKGKELLDTDALKENAETKLSKAEIFLNELAEQLKSVETESKNNPEAVPDFATFLTDLLTNVTEAISEQAAGN